jgi:hypothetical protein
MDARLARQLAWLERGGAMDDPWQLMRLLGEVSAADRRAALTRLLTSRDPLVLRGAMWLISECAAELEDAAPLLSGVSIELLDPRGAAWLLDYNMIWPDALDSPLVERLRAMCGDG